MKVTVPGPTKTVTVIRQAVPAKTARAPNTPAPVAAPPGLIERLSRIAAVVGRIGPSGRSDACGLYRGDMRAALLESWAEDAPMSVVQQFFASKCN